MLPSLKLLNAQQFIWEMKHNSNSLALCERERTLQINVFENLESRYILADCLPFPWIYEIHSVHSSRKCLCKYACSDDIVLLSRVKAKTSISFFYYSQMVLFLSHSWAPPPPQHIVRVLLCFVVLFLPILQCTMGNILSAKPDQAKTLTATKL